MTMALDDGYGMFLVSRGDFSQWWNTHWGLAQKIVSLFSFGGSGHLAALRVAIS